VVREGEGGGRRGRSVVGVWYASQRKAIEEVMKPREGGDENWGDGKRRGGGRGRRS
jgi:hypothetical protein